MPNLKSKPTLDSSLLTKVNSSYIYEKGNLYHQGIRKDKSKLDGAFQSSLEKRESMKPEQPLYLDVAKQFKKDVNLCKKQGRDLDKLWDIVETLRNREPLNPRHKKHSLFGQYKGSWECHIKPDWLLIWDVEAAALRLIRTGSHSELFE